MRYYKMGFLLVLILQACIKVEEIRNIPKYSVYCILNPDASNIELFLAKTYAVNQAFPIDSGKYVQSARVSIEGSNGSKALMLNKQTKKYEVENQAFIVENSIYRLLIVVERDTLKSQVYVPMKTKLILEEALVDENDATVRVAWEKDDQGKVSYRLLGSVDTGLAATPFFYWGSEFGVWRTNGDRGGERLVRSPVGNFVFGKSTDKVNVEISLEALDNNFYDFRNKLDALLIRDSFTQKFESPNFYTSNVSNAAGVFGAMTKTEMNIEMKKP